VKTFARLVLAKPLVSLLIFIALIAGASVWGLQAFSSLSLLVIIAAHVRGPSAAIVAERQRERETGQRYGVTQKVRAIA
jgi:hypothetical protein